MSCGEPMACTENWQYHVMTWEDSIGIGITKKAGAKKTATLRYRYQVIRLVLAAAGKDITLFAREDMARDSMDAEIAIYDTARQPELGIRLASNASSTAKHEAYAKFFKCNRQELI
jgi:hypothetical protein